MPAASMAASSSTDTRDSQSQGNVAVDQATQLVNIKKVPVIIGGIISLGVDPDPDLGHRRRPGVVQVSPASSSPTLTALGREGKTNGVFFRTITSDALQGTAAAKYAIDQGLKKIAIIHVNNDFGVNMVSEFADAYEALGGTITSVTPYNEKQSSYAAEATRRHGGRAGGALPRQLPGRRRHHRPRLDLRRRPAEVPAQRRHELDRLHQGASARKYLNNAYGTSSGTSRDGLDRVLQRQLRGLLRRHQARRTRRPTAPMTRAPSSALAIAKAGKADAGRDQGGDPARSSIRPASRSTPARRSSPRRSALIKEGKPITL